MYRAKPSSQVIEIDWYLAHTTIVEMGSTIDDRNASLTLRELQHGAKFAEFFGITSHSKFCKWQSRCPLPGKVCSYCFGAGSGLIGSQFFIIPSIFSRLVLHSLLKFCGLSFSFYFRRVKFFIPNVRTLNTPCWFSFVSCYSSFRSTTLTTTQGAFDWGYSGTRITGITSRLFFMG